MEAIKEKHFLFKLNRMIAFKLCFIRRNLIRRAHMFAFLSNIEEKIPISFTFKINRIKPPK